MLLKSIRIRVSFAAATLAVAPGCVHIISPYDVNLDRGLGDFRKSVNVLVIDAAVKTGTPEGTFDKFKPRYADLETQLVLMRSYAMVGEASDVKCEPVGALKDVIARVPGLTKQLKDLATAAAAPASKTKDVPVTPLTIGTADASAAKGCMTKLIENIGAQLLDLELIHSDPAQCANPADAKLTCIRSATAPLALDAMNRSIDMALLVQIAKKKAQEE